MSLSFYSIYNECKHSEVANLLCCALEMITHEYCVTQSYDQSPWFTLVTMDGLNLWNLHEVLRLVVREIYISQPHSSFEWLLVMP